MFPLNWQISSWSHVFFKLTDLLLEQCFYFNWEHSSWDHVSFSWKIFCWSHVYFQVMDFLLEQRLLSVDRTLHGPMFPFSCQISQCSYVSFQLRDIFLGPCFFQLEDLFLEPCLLSIDSHLLGFRFPFNYPSVQLLVKVCKDSHNGGLIFKWRFMLLLDEKLKFSNFFPLLDPENIIRFKYR